MSGRFVWYELMTTDTKGAIAFYTEVIGWKLQPFEGGPPGEPYNMWVASQGPIGGVMPLAEQAKKIGAPPQWMAHVEVADVDATVAKAKSLGAKVYVEPTDIPTVGRFSVIADPQGASISVFKPTKPMDAHDTTKTGEISWNELSTSDQNAALSFYSALFGWNKTSEMDGPAGKYIMYGQGEKMYGGMMKTPPQVPLPPMWFYYINVDDIEAAMARATSKGATALFGPMEVPGGSFAAQLKDPQGAIFALLGPKKK